MQSKAATVAEYLAELPEDHRRAIEAVRKVILDNLDSGYEEGMQYGMIGYYVPHRIYPAGYHCDPKQPLPFAALASQKNYMSLYLMCIYGETPLAAWFREAWAKTGKKLDAGKACIRFKSSMTWPSTSSAMRFAACPPRSTSPCASPPKTNRPLAQPKKPRRPGRQRKSAGDLAEFGAVRSSRAPHLAFRFFATLPMAYNHWTNGTFANLCDP